MEEKIYKFIKTEADTPYHEHEFFLKESELEDSHKDVLLGQLIKYFNESPNDVQLKFMMMLIEEVESKQDEKRINKLESDATV